MSDDQPIGEVTLLIEKWLTLQSNGLQISVEELCRQSPELIEQVRQELSSIRKMDDLLANPTPADTVNMGTRTGSARCENAYVLQRLLGHGGCSEVYLAHDEKLGRHVAVKFLRPDTKDLPKLQSRLKQEAEITSQLNHPGVVAIHSAGDMDGLPFYTMQFIEGDALSQAIQDFHNALDTDELYLSDKMRKLLKHFVDVCQTIAFAHDNNVIHRDIKPANIVTGQFGETYVIDWGLARRTTDQDDRSAVAMGDMDPRLTQHGHSLGTPAYMSPEQVIGENVGKPSDVFNLGATLYSILVGRSPYQSESLVENLRNAQAANFMDPKSVNARVPAALNAICCKAMSSEPADRYHSATELAAEIERYMADQPIVAMPTPWSDRIRRWLVRHRTAVTTLATTALVGLILLAVGNSLLLKSNRELTLSEATARQRLYSQLIAVANSQIDNNNIVRAEEILQQCPAEYRQWEWHLLKNVVNRHKPLVALEFPGDQIRSLDLDDDGRRLAAGDDSGIVWVWDTESWQRQHKLNARLGIRQIAFVPGQNKIVACGRRRSRAEGRLSLIDLAIGKVENRIGLESQFVSAIAVSKDGKRLVAAEFTHDQTGKISIFETATLTPIHSWENAHQDRINALSIDDERGHIVAGGADGRITIWDFKGNRMAERETSTASVMSFDRQADIIATAGADNIVQVWNTDSEPFNLRNTFADHTDQVLAVSLDPKQHFAASAGMDRDIHIWDLKRARRAETIKRHSSHVRCLKFHPRKPLLFSGGEDRVVNVWDTTRLSRTVPTGLHVGFARLDTQTLVVGNEREMSIWDAKDGQPRLRFNDHPAAISGIAAGQRILASYYFQGYCRVWELGSGRLIGEFGDRKHEAIFAACVSDDDSKLCLLHHLNVIEVIDLKDDSVVNLQTNDRPYRMAVDWNKQRLLVATRSGTLEVFDLTNNSQIGTIHASQEPLLAVSIHPVKNHVATASSDGSISVWEIDSQRMVCQMRSGSSWLNCLSYTPDGKRIVSGNEHTLTCWDSGTGQEIVSMTMPRCVHELAFNIDGSLLALASGTRDGVAKTTTSPDIKIFDAAE